MRDVNTRLEGWVGAHPLRAIPAFAAAFILAWLLTGLVLSHRLYWPHWPEFVSLDLLLPVVLVAVTHERVRRAGAD